MLVQKNNSEPTLVFIRRDAADKLRELVRDGTITNYQKINRVPFNDEEKKLIKILASKGKMGSEISKELNRSYGSITTYLWRNRIKLRESIKKDNLEKDIISLSQISITMGLNLSALKKTVIEKFGVESIVFKKFGGTSADYITTELSKEVIKFVEKNKVREDEISINSLSQIVGIQCNTLKKMIIHEFGENAISLKKFGTPGWGDYIPIKYKTKILELVKTDKVKQDEISLHELTEITKTSSRTLKNTIIREFGPEALKFRKFGKVPGYYAPAKLKVELLKLMSEHKVKQNEISVSKLAEFAKIGDRTLKNTIIREFGPEALKFRKFGKVPGYYISVKFKKLILEHVKKNKVRENEVSINELSRTFHIGNLNLRNIITNEFGEDAIKVRKYGIGGNAYGYYVSSEITEKLTHLKKLSRLSKTT